MYHLWQIMTNQFKLHNSSDIKLSLLVILLNFSNHTQKIIYTHIDSITTWHRGYFISLYRSFLHTFCLLTLGKCRVLFHSLISKTRGREPGLFTVPTLPVRTATMYISLIPNNKKEQTSMLINAQNTSKTSTSRKQTQMSLLDQISCFVSINRHWAGSVWATQG